jgi:hypothetical protein
LDTRNKTDKYSFNNFLQYLKPGIYNNFRWQMHSQSLMKS